MAHLNFHKRWYQRDWHEDFISAAIGAFLAAVLLFPWDAQAQTCCTPQEWELIGITAEKIAYAFGWGFGAVVFCWFFGFGIGAAIEAIKKL
jgi:hypothetical protein